MFSHHLTCKLFEVLVVESRMKRAYLSHVTAHVLGDALRSHSSEAKHTRVGVGESHKWHHCQGLGSISQGLARQPHRTRKLSRLASMLSLQMLVTFWGADSER